MNKVKQNDWVIIAGNDHKMVVTNPWGGFKIELRVEDDHPERPTSSCTHMWNYSNGATSGSVDNEDDDVDYWHICDFEDFVQEMQSLNELRKAYARGEIKVGCTHEICSTFKKERTCQACGENL